MHDKAYMAEVESLLEKLTEEEKDKLILNLARRQEENERAFLKLMGKKEISPQPILMNQDEVTSFLKWLDEVNQGILYLECSYDETDEDYPWDTGYEILYGDKEGIGSRMKEGVLLAEKLLQGKYYEEALAIGWKALEEIPGSLVIRAEICDRMIPLALRMGDSEAVHRLMKLAFSSDSTLPRYLKLFQLPGFREAITAASEEIELLPKRLNGAERAFSRELTTNSISDYERDVIHFFSGRFHEIFEKCRADSASLGWSSSLKRVVVPLFILALNKEEALTEAAEMLWQETAVKLGNCSREDLLQDFMNWKQVMAEEIRELEDYMDWIREESDKRVNAVVGGGFRQSYHKAALLLINLGQMLESRGCKGSTKEIAERYRNRYKRHRAFKEELNVLGL